MQKRPLKGKPKQPIAVAYNYAIANEVTGLDFVGTIWAVDKTAAKTLALDQAKCFGKSTKLVGVKLAE